MLYIGYIIYIEEERNFPEVGCLLQFKNSSAWRRTTFLSSPNNGQLLYCRLDCQRITYNTTALHPLIRDSGKCSKRYSCTRVDAVPRLRATNREPQKRKKDSFLKIR